MLRDGVIPAIVGRVARAQSRRVMHFDGGPVDWPPPGVNPERVAQLYIHIPFCKQLCPFCTFHRVRYQADSTAAYFAALRHELAWYREQGFRFTKLYVGGGTPTVEPDGLEALLADVREQFPLREISVETNPRELTGAVLKMLERSGVTRLSVGVQSFDDGLLRGMGRYEAYGGGAQIRECLNEARGRLHTLNVDMMFNLPGQDRRSLAKDLDILAGELRADQVSYYPLMVAPTARRSIRLRMADRSGRSTAGREREYYAAICERLTPDYGMGSVWCFTRGGGAIDEYFVDENDYIGAGSGSFSYVNGVTASTTFSIRGYIEQMANGGAPVVQSRRLSLRERMRYDLLLKLFGLKLDKSMIERKYEGRFARTLRTDILALRAVNAIEDTGTHYVLTGDGTYLWVVLMREFLNGVNSLRADMRHQIRSELRELERSDLVPDIDLQTGRSQ